MHTRFRVLRDRPWLLAILLAVLPNPSHAQLLPPARDHWLARDTAHFTIHYQRGSEALAETLAAIAEETYEAFRRELRLEPRGRVLVFLQERYDIVNSLSAPAMHRSIYIFPDPPYGEPYAQMGHYDDWLRLAFTHEYAHTVDLELTGGLWDLIGAVTGFRYPNGLRPLWTMEGFAIWCESTIGNGGRLGSPTSEMVLRADVLARRFRETDEWSGAFQPWPREMLAYLYGGLFFQYVSEKYGAHVPREFRQNTAGALPFRFADALPLLARGKPFSILLSEFHRTAKLRADSTLVWIRSQGELLEGDLVVRLDGTTVLDYLPSRNGDCFYLVCDSDYEGQRLVRLRPEVGSLEGIRAVRGTNVRITEGPGWGELTYSDLEVEGNSDLVSRLCTVNVRTGRLHSVSGSQGLFEPSVSTTDGAIAACERAQGRSSLVRLVHGRKEYLTLGLSDNARVFHPAWSPDGRRLVASVWYPGGRQDVSLLEKLEGTAVPLTNDEHWDIHPVFSADGRFVLFVSDRTGIWNIYAVDLLDGRLFRVTNVTTGAFLPKVSADGQWVYFLRYSADGDEIRRIPYAPETWAEIRTDSCSRLPFYDAYLGRLKAQRNRSDSSHVGRDSHPGARVASRSEGLGRLRFLRPILHIPLPMADEQGLGVGLLFMGIDPLGREGYGGLLAYGFNSGRPSYALALQSYPVAQLRVELSAEDMALPTDQMVTTYSDTTYIWRRDRGWAASIYRPYLKLMWTFEPFLGLRRTRTEAVVSPDWAHSDLPEPDFVTGRTTQIRAGLRFSNAQRHQLSFTQVSGITASAALWTRQRALGAERTGDGFDADVRAYRGIHKDIALAARGTVAQGKDIEIGPAGAVSVIGDKSTHIAAHAYSVVGEVRFRLTEIQDKILWDWIFAHRAHGALFVQHAGHDRRSAEGWSNTRPVWSAGARFSVDVTLGFSTPDSWDLVLAVPSRGDPSVSIEISSAF